MFVDPVGLTILAGAMAVAGIVTWIAARLLARVATRRLLPARVGAALAAPLLMLTFGFARFRIDAAAHPGSDWPAMGLAGAMLIALLMPAATLPMAWLTLRRARSGGGPRPASRMIRLERDSVCMADDVDAPHAQPFPLAAADTLADIVAKVARSAYLPMPGDAWGWTIEAGGAVVAIRPGWPRRRVVALAGDPAAVSLENHAMLTALYVRPGSRWRDASASSSTSRNAEG